MNARNKHGDSALSIAAMYGRTQLITMLLEYGEFYTVWIVHYRVWIVHCRVDSMHHTHYTIHALQCVIHAL